MKRLIVMRHEEIDITGVLSSQGKENLYSFFLPQLLLDKHFFDPMWCIIHSPSLRTTETAIIIEQFLQAKNFETIREDVEYFWAASDAPNKKNVYDIYNPNPLSVWILIEYILKKYSVQQAIVVAHAEIVSDLITYVGDLLKNYCKFSPLYGEAVCFDFLKNNIKIFSKKNRTMLQN